MFGNDRHGTASWRPLTFCAPGDINGASACHRRNQPPDRRAGMTRGVNVGVVEHYMTLPADESVG